MSLEALKIQLLFMNQYDFNPLNVNNLSKHESIANCQTVPYAYEAEV